ncbi:ABC transporter ATP-binding protein [uncultured Enterovirga sp.]|uniref:ABC transporter ATP-binding protein n=1 Tax=uncultured Enterovirga sp. TaxID=2026352 RepID=UPI0035CBEC98
MIRLEAVTKLFPGSARPAVDGIDIEVPEGRTCVLIGPSGCGKTTTLRMVNRLVEPSSGRILLGGRDVTHVDPVWLRRGMGYVIQGTGLFPHLSVGDNVATVPRLLRWDAARVAARTDEMLALVGLDPATYRDRRPASLSGGQRQRVGVARALAADPPVLLMDEPFGAVDPVVRARLQREVAEILRRLGKTVILVTHDIDEAIRMGNTVAIMREGRIVQHDTPNRLLASPADAFVADFVGANRALRRLTLVTAGEVAAAGLPRPPGPEIGPETSLQEALSVMLACGVDALPLADGRTLTLDAIRKVAALDGP